ncbi:MAG: Xaa-Pro peptidase family protein [Candidatus Woykebacteria bacterium]
MKSQKQNDLEVVLAKRLALVQQRLKENRLDAFIITAAPNRYYISGWLGDFESGWILITLDKVYILTDFRYTEHAISAAKGFEVLEYESSLPTFFGDLSKKLKFTRVGFESHNLSVFNLMRLKKFCLHLKLIPVSHLVEESRLVKDTWEVDQIKKAVEIADKAFEHILNFVKTGMAEKEISWEMEKFMREQGAEKMAWDPFIVATGPHASMAHWAAGDTKIKKGDMVLVDYGCVVNGYHSDTSRVFFVGKPSEEQKKIYNLVFEAQKLGISLIEQGRSAYLVDQKVRSLLETKTKHFYRHSLGHGVGLEVHELPRLSVNAKNKLQEGQVLTVEPGIYIPGWGGVRLEDIVVVTKNGPQILTEAPKDIDFLIV